ncbi:hypothetical protein F5Y17DRAFT_226358 [Xylariaceae sp. FL0594]|nr:hypothetical protein F5Y17DRAFT_226358 [Xylariaceae sp. FL0594]
MCVQTDHLTSHSQGEWSTVIDPRSVGSITMEVLEPHARELYLGSEREDDLCFGPQPSVPLSRSYSESHASLSSASSIREPVTPISGRSSPTIRQHESLFLLPSFCGCWTPSDHHRLYHENGDVKTELSIYPEPNYNSPPMTEIRRTSIHASTIDTIPYPFYQPIEPIATLLHDTTIHPTNPSCYGFPIHAQQWGPYTYCEPDGHHQLHNLSFSAWRNEPDIYLGPAFEPIQAAEAATKRKRSSPANAVNRREEMQRQRRRRRPSRMYN